MVDLNESASIEIRLFDAMGRVVIQESSYRDATFIQTLNLESLSARMYIVQVKIGKIIMTERLVKK
ncbi:T9SS type A sorting domain-containing protein [Mongoliitalea daihaiensis]|nr:T9SS type A sorting domain-containing protein [Mongoliitalea daihaiensis]